MDGKNKEKTVFVDGGVCAAQGFHAAGMYAGFKKSRKKDLSLIYSETLCDAAAAYTTNKVKGATLKVTMEHLADGKAQAVITNSGYANTLAPNGMEIARKTCALTGGALGLKKEDVIVCSTGVIGQPPMIGPFEKGIPKLAKAVLAGGGPEDKYYGAGNAAEAIMTTDTVRKEAAAEFKIGSRTCRIGGMAKGSGMINPNMATMLVFITTDVNISPPLLRDALKSDINHSFNQISIDGDTSTNDTVVILANGKAGNKRINAFGSDFAAFAAALNRVTVKLSRMLAKDGEGATKLIECRVKNAPTDELAMKIAKMVIQSDLVKTAIYGSDANWGRILCAVGYTPGNFNTDNVDVVLSSSGGQVTVCEASFAVAFDEALAKQVLDMDEIQILVNLHDGMANAEAYGCDLTYDYVKINGMYRT
ncbi:MAG: bifunctional glutamate N-acetyltransferase/amino-acid acetyltransferase ArgJ [Clostridiales Family XIII bacterium]|jgi:glutamate N-acetyltransferase/amino-acid N-acetyltransferase|nr:bifunctional glutamate N-acetyltransferase/amino-acid acetyltransferase ArgJ [Clostridiales Family XIII bacterium]